MQLVRKVAIVGALALIASAAQAGAQSYTGSFGGAGYTEYTDLGYATATSSAFTFIHGEYYQQLFAGTGLTSAQSLALTLNVEGNPYGGNQIFTAFLNNMAVGTYSLSTQEGPTSFLWTFAPVAANGTSGQDFTLRLEQTGPTLAPGTGSTAFLFSGSSATLSQNITTTPEPATFALLGTGLIGLAPFTRRKSKRG
jgi:hypothetical protein